MGNPLEWPQDLTIRGYSRAERETILRWDEEAGVVIAWSASTTQLRKLQRAGFIPRQIMRDAKTGRLHGIECTLPLAEFRWGRKRKAGHIPSGRPFNRTLAAAASIEHEGGKGEVASRDHRGLEAPVDGDWGDDG